MNTLDIADNIFLGREHLKHGFTLDRKRMHRESTELLRQLGIKIPIIQTEVSYLSGGQRQGVAVARVVHQGGKLLIFDEPTAAMGINETRAVLRLIKVWLKMVLVSLLSVIIWIRSLTYLIVSALCVRGDRRSGKD